MSNDYKIALFYMLMLSFEASSLASEKLHDTGVIQLDFDAQEVIPGDDRLTVRWSDHSGAPLALAQSDNDPAVSLAYTDDNFFKSSLRKYELLIRFSQEGDAAFLKMKVDNPLKYQIILESYFKLQDFVSQLIPLSKKIQAIELFNKFMQTQFDKPIEDLYELIMPDMVYPTQQKRRGALLGVDPLVAIENLQKIRSEKQALRQAYESEQEIDDEDIDDQNDSPSQASDQAGVADSRNFDMNESDDQGSEEFQDDNPKRQKLS